MPRLMQRRVAEIEYEKDMAKQERKANQNKATTMAQQEQARRVVPSMAAAAAAKAAGSTGAAAGAKPAAPSATAANAMAQINAAIKQLPGQLPESEAAGEEAAAATAATQKKRRSSISIAQLPKVVG